MYVYSLTSTKKTIHVYSIVHTSASGGGGILPLATKKIVRLPPLLARPLFTSSPPPRPKSGKSPPWQKIPMQNENFFPEKFQNFGKKYQKKTFLPNFCLFF